MSRTQLAGLILAVAATTAAPATASAAPTPPPRVAFSLDVGTSEAVVAPTAGPNGIIAILIGLAVPPRPRGWRAAGCRSARRPLK